MYDDSLPLHDPMESVIYQHSRFEYAAARRAMDRLYRRGWRGESHPHGLRRYRKWVARMEAKLSVARAQAGVTEEQVEAVMRMPSV